MSEFPVTKRTDVAPEPYTTKKKERGESFDEAANLPNNPTKNHRPESYNVTDDYCSPMDGDE